MGPIRLVQVSVMTLTVDEERMRSAVSNDKARLAPSAKMQSAIPNYTPNEPVEKRDNKADAGRGQPRADEVTKTLREYAVDCVVCHGEGDKVRYIVRWYGHSIADDTVEPLEHIPEYFIIRYWCCVQKNYPAENNVYKQTSTGEGRHRIN